VISVKLRRPQDQIAGCCWLPRFSDKARLYLSGLLPLLYRVAFGSPIGTDGYFLRHFKLSARQFLAGVRRAQTDDELVRWFVAQPGVSQQRIAEWNVVAPNLGASGHPGYVTRHLVKWVLYPKSVRNPVRSLFEAIEQDEDTGPFAGH
jgi:hypothetical protein